MASKTPEQLWLSRSQCIDLYKVLFGMREALQKDPDHPVTILTDYRNLGISVTTKDSYGEVQERIFKKLPMRRAKQASTFFTIVEFVKAESPGFPQMAALAIFLEKGWMTRPDQDFEIPWKSLERRFFDLTRSQH